MAAEEGIGGAAETSRSRPVRPNPGRRRKNGKIVILDSRNPERDRGKQGGFLAKDGFVYKILKHHELPSYRVSYIFFDQSKMPMEEIQTLRELLIAKIEEGLPFEELVNQYSAGEKKNGGDLGWLRDRDQPGPRG